MLPKMLNLWLQRMVEQLTVVRRESIKYFNKNQIFILIRANIID